MAATNEPTPHRNGHTVLRSNLDTILGGAGNDRIEGGGGGDVLRGGLGADRFNAYFSRVDIEGSDLGTDKLLDFKLGEGDRVAVGLDEPAQTILDRLDLDNNGRLDTGDQDVTVGSVTAGGVTKQSLTVTLDSADANEVLGFTFHGLTEVPLSAFTDWDM